MPSAAARCVLAALAALPSSIVCAANIPGELDRYKTYETLYSQLGYHGNLGLTHAAPIIAGVVKHTYRREVRGAKRVLDVGCSHGRGVDLLWRSGFCASGMDLATTAIKMATDHRMPRMPARCATRETVFRQGSAAAIPWPNATFHAILSTDVLEHVPEALVPTVVAEFGRVATEHLFLIIAAQPEGEIIRYGPGGDPRHGFVGRLRNVVPETETLHETVRGPEWWIAQFERRGEWACAVMHRTLVRRHAFTAMRFRGGNVTATRVEAQRGLDEQGRPLVNFWLKCTRRVGV